MKNLRYCLYRYFPNNERWVYFRKGNEGEGSLRSRLNFGKISGRPDESADEGVEKRDNEPNLADRLDMPLASGEEHDEKPKEEDPPSSGLSLAQRLAPIPGTPEAEARTPLAARTETKIETTIQEHIVQTNETPQKIAQFYGITFEELAKQNPGKIWVKEKDKKNYQKYDPKNTISQTGHPMFGQEILYK